MAKIQVLVQKHVKHYELIKRSFFKKEARIKPVIAFSREAGSGGRLIGQLVCKQLKYEFYDKNLIDLIAREAKLEKEVILDLDEKKEHALGGIIRRLFGKNPLPQQSYIRALSHTILTIAEKGSSVIVGRGANFIIPQEKCFRVRVMAPLKIRVKNNIIYEKQSEERAREDIKKIHFNRKNFITKHFSKNISNTNYYDLVINTKNLTIDEAASLAIKLYQERFCLL